MLRCSGPKDQWNKTENFLSLTGTLYVIVNSQKDQLKENQLEQDLWEIQL